MLRHLLKNTKKKVNALSFNDIQYIRCGANGEVDINDTIIWPQHHFTPCNEHFTLPL